MLSTGVWALLLLPHPTKGTPCSPGVMFYPRIGVPRAAQL